MMSREAMAWENGYLLPAKPGPGSQLVTKEVDERSSPSDLKRPSALHSASCQRAEAAPAGTA